MEYFFPGIAWTFHAIILLLENSVKSNLISDSLLDKNLPFGVEKKVSDHLQIFPKLEDSALTQMYRDLVLNNKVRGFLVLCFSGEYFKNSRVLYHIYLTQ